MPSILCVDDEPTQLILLKFAFERAGFTVLSANDGQEAVELTTQHRPDIILMDLMMPVKDGYQATVEIKADSNLAHIPIVLYTAYDQEVLAEQAKQAGAAEIIRKTTPPKALVAKINELLASYQTES
jgi:twitching motility two-component system response regulator PilH